MSFLVEINYKKSSQTEGTLKQNLLNFFNLIQRTCPWEKTQIIENENPMDLLLNSIIKNIKQDIENCFSNELKSIDLLEMLFQYMNIECTAISNYIDEILKNNKNEILKKTEINFFILKNTIFYNIHSFLITVFDENIKLLLQTILSKKEGNHSEEFKKNLEKSLLIFLDHHHVAFNLYKKISCFLDKKSIKKIIKSTEIYYHFNLAQEIKNKQNLCCFFKEEFYEKNNLENLFALLYTINNFHCLETTKIKTLSTLTVFQTIMEKKKNGELVELDKIYAPIVHASIILKHLKRVENNLIYLVTNKKSLNFELNDLTDIEKKILIILSAKKILHIPQEKYINLIKLIKSNHIIDNQTYDILLFNMKKITKDIVRVDEIEPHKHLLKKEIYELFFPNLTKKFVKNNMVVSKKVTSKKIFFSYMHFQLILKEKNQTNNQKNANKNMIDSYIEIQYIADFFKSFYEENTNSIPLYNMHIPYIAMVQNEVLNIIETVTPHLFKFFIDIYEFIKIILNYQKTVLKSELIISNIENFTYDMKLDFLNKKNEILQILANDELISLKKNALSTKENDSVFSEKLTTNKKKSKKKKKKKKKKSKNTESESNNEINPLLSKPLPSFKMEDLSQVPIQAPKIETSHTNLAEQTNNENAENIKIINKKSEKNLLPKNHTKKIIKKQNIIQNDAISPPSLPNQKGSLEKKELNLKHFKKILREKNVPENHVVITYAPFLSRVPSFQLNDLSYTHIFLTQGKVYINPQNHQLSQAFKKCDLSNFITLIIQKFDALYLQNTFENQLSCFNLCLEKETLQTWMEKTKKISRSQSIAHLSNMKHPPLETPLVAEPKKIIKKQTQKSNLLRSTSFYTEKKEQNEEPICASPISTPPLKKEKFEIKKELSEKNNLSHTSNIIILEKNQPQKQEHTVPETSKQVSKERHPLKRSVSFLLPHPQKDKQKATQKIQETLMPIPLLQKQQKPLLDVTEYKAGQEFRFRLYAQENSPQNLAPLLEIQLTINGKDCEHLYELIFISKYKDTSFPVTFYHPHKGCFFHYTALDNYHYWLKVKGGNQISDILPPIELVHFVYGYHLSNTNFYLVRDDGSFTPMDAPIFPEPSSYPF